VDSGPRELARVLAESFVAPKVRRGGELDPATDGHYSG
jgi:hypothetical protein